MNVLNLILNLAAVLLWIDWRSGCALKKRSSRPTISITDSVQPAERSQWRGLGSLGVLFLLLLLRAVVYNRIGTGVNWIPRTDLVAVSIPWRTDSFWMMAGYSFVSFLAALGMYFSWLLLLSALNRSLEAADPVQRVVRLQLGRIDSLPAVVKVLLVPLCAGLAWLGLSSILIYAGMFPETAEAVQFRQVIALMLASPLVWKWLLLGLFAIHFVNLYVFLGAHPIWNYISITARKLLWPLGFLRFAQVDLSPVAGIIAVALLADSVLAPLVHRLFVE